MLELLTRAVEAIARGIADAAARALERRRATDARAADVADAAERARRTDAELERQR